MSSSIDQLFGKDASKNSSIASLFQNPNSIEKIIPVRQNKIGQDNYDTTEIDEISTTTNVENNTEENDQKQIKKKKKNSSKDENDDLESKYFEKLIKENDQGNKNDDKKEAQSELTSNSENKEVAKPAKQIDFKQDEIEKAQRTIFVGNVPTEVITSRDTYKRFKKLFSPENKDITIQSIRFRSISFDEPLPRKIAFARQSFHKDRHSINAYIVYSKSDGLSKFCKQFNGYVFESRHLRVDSVAHPAPHYKRKSIFVGNLDFEEDEESLWSHFGPIGEIDYIRIVRDSKTNVGKGFAYVQFKELESVNKALLLNDKPMKSIHSGRSRKLRVTRCKNIKSKFNNDKNNGTDSSNKILNEQQKTKLGRAKKILNKADRATLGKELTIEGMRAEKSSKGRIGSLLRKRKPRSKDGRVTKRSIAYKKAQANNKK